MNSRSRMHRAAPAAAPHPGDAGRRIAFDVTGLLAWYRYRSHVTGIQRIAERILTAPAVIDDPAVSFVARRQGMNGFAAVDRAVVAELGDTARRPCAVAALRDLGERIEAATRPPPLLARLAGRGRKVARHPPAATLAAGDALVNLVDFWTLPDTADCYRRACANGIRLVQFIYDIIPESHPHLCHEASIAPFRAALEPIARVAAAFLVDSAHVRRAFSAYLAAKGQPERPMVQVPFGWEFAAPAAAEAVAAALTPFGLAPGGYILQVGTLEPRKNHLLVVRSLHRLYGRLGARLPPTVFVGRLGWKTDALMQELAALDYLGGRIRVLDDVDDTGLAALYRGCRFTLFPSFVEGWGLPVQESLQFGRPCLASHAASIPEAGLDLAEYIDPYDGEAFAAALERWILDDAHIAAMSRRIAAHFAAAKLATWNDGARTTMDFVRANALAPAGAARAVAPGRR